MLFKFYGNVHVVEGFFLSQEFLEFPGSPKNSSWILKNHSYSGFLSNSNDDLTIYYIFEIDNKN